MSVSEILEAIRSLSALVVGDICLDRWCTYDPALAEPSRETGIPRIAVVETEVTPGAGGTVANNLAALKAARVAVLGVVGEDGHGWELQRALEQQGIETGLLVSHPQVPTFTYTKLINKDSGQEDLPRVDFVVAREVPVDAERAVLARLEEVASQFDAVLVSDQAETDVGGVVTPRVREALSHLARRYPSKVFWVDSRKRIHEFCEVIIKPNTQEADEACRRLFGVVDYGCLRRHVRAPLMVVTCGAAGAIVVDERGQRHVRTRPVERPVDICGAGDSFTAGAALALAAHATAEEAAAFGNLVASVTIMKKGTGTASPEEVLEAARKFEDWRGRTCT